MNEEQQYDLKEIGRHFDIKGEYVDGNPYGTGHINDTFKVIFLWEGQNVPYIFQRINHFVFKDPEALMENIGRVTRHQKIKRANLSQASRRSLNFSPSDNGTLLYRDKCDETYWRAYRFIDKAKTYDVVRGPDMAFQAAKAFGNFQLTLVDLDGPRLNETIPDFHNTPKRMEDFEQVLDGDHHNRAALAGEEVDFALKWKPKTSYLLDLYKKGEIPERVTHNDCKLNNVLIDDRTQEGLCVIDLDTVMPGLSLYDFGDMVRTSVSPSEEDEKDLSKIKVQLPMFEALARGFLESAGEILTPAEKSNLVFSGKLITFEIGLRFLTDFLEGDVYFKTSRENHNLDRCRTQFRLVQEIEKIEDILFSFVDRL